MFVSADGHSYNDVDYSSIITGVAIGDAKINVNLVFGCYAGKPHQGGAGLLRVKKDGTQRQIFPLFDDAGKIYAGSVFFGCGNNGMFTSAGTCLLGHFVWKMIYLSLVYSVLGEIIMSRLI